MYNIQALKISIFRKQAGNTVTKHIYAKYNNKLRLSKMGIHMYNIFQVLSTKMCKQFKFRANHLFLLFL